MVQDWGLLAIYMEMRQTRSVQYFITHSLLRESKFSGAFNTLKPYKKICYRESMERRIGFQLDVFHTNNFATEPSLTLV
jgi:hypothetical protein